ncbi:hypothetical protein IQ244_15580 [Nostoc sp. LEGE 06077]|uniref:hypothetical protein n=1 Tax=Nostoc sp. LEGE 06077 TaxID=915325 RepID=UPI001880EC63|nr:hypothetical protein [Nostoc sp. LEGE 06077]MBE9207919.1 hypothetical protein [Nostoc sp. LEGE 06077]
MKQIYPNFSLLKLIKYSFDQKKLIVQLDSLGIKFIALIELLCDRRLSCQSDSLWHQIVVLTSIKFRHPVQLRPLLYLQLLLRS